MDCFKETNFRFKPTAFQTIIRVEAELVVEPGGVSGNRLNVSYMLEENEARSNIVHDSNFVKSVQERNYVFACDGKTFALIRNHDRLEYTKLMVSWCFTRSFPYHTTRALLSRIVQRGKIFARMLPEQKIHLIECMKDLGYVHMAKLLLLLLLLLLSLFL